MAINDEYSGRELLIIFEDHLEAMNKKNIIGIKAISSILSSIRQITFTSHNFELTRLYTNLSLTSRLLRNLLEKKITASIQENITKYSDKIGLDNSIKEMLKRELLNFNSDKYLDSDLVLLFEELRKDLTTFKSLSCIPDAQLQSEIASKATSVIFTVIGVSSQETVELINQKVLTFIQEVVRLLKTSPSVEAVTKAVDAFNKKLHYENYSWPKE